MTVGSAELTSSAPDDAQSSGLTPRSATAIGAGVSAAVVLAMAALGASPLQIVLATGLATLWGLLPRFTRPPSPVEPHDQPEPAWRPEPAEPPPAFDPSPAMAVDPMTAAADDRRLRDLGAASASGFATCGQTMNEANQAVYRGQQLLAESVASLLESFEGLKHQAERQSELVVNLVEQFSRSRDDSAGVLERFIEETDAAMRDFVEHIVLVSKQSMAMATRVSDITTQMDEIEAVTVRARKLASNTSMLALNAKIEAAQAGQHAAGFTVIADEVQALARESQDFNEKISGLVGTMRQTVEDTQTAIQELASQDRNRAVHARSRADSLGSEVERLNHEMRESLDTVSEVAKRVDQDIAEAVRALQFEDIVRQTLDHTIAVLEEGRATTQLAQRALVDNLTDPGLASILDNAFAKHDAEVQSIHKTAEQETMQEGDIELF